MDTTFHKLLLQPGMQKRPLTGNIIYNRNSHKCFLLSV